MSYRLLPGPTRCTTERQVNMEVCSIICWDMHSVPHASSFEARSGMRMLCCTWTGSSSHDNRTAPRVEFSHGHRFRVLPTFCNCGRLGFACGLAPTRLLAFTAESFPANTQGRALRH